ncbi:4'-phosphopantetheinyl transferase superfamily [Baffinella frigidus]|nr:4'-phosphopantetheinyl transferase superfamily [Cryptophyta sp. CCMP2293]
MSRLAMYAGEGWCPTGRQWDLLMSLPSSEERERIKRFRFAKDAKLALVGRLLLLHACCTALGVEWGTAEIGRTKEGKPYLIRAAGAGGQECKGKPWLNLNLSHHGNWVVLAVEEEELVGADVMTTARPRPEEELVGADVMTTARPRPGESVERFLGDFGDYFTPLEWRAMREAAAGDEDAMLRAFFTFCFWNGA